MRKFDYYQPTSYEEAFNILATTNKKVMPFAGGTDLIPHTRDGAWEPDIVVDIKKLPGIHATEVKHIEPCCGFAHANCLFVGAAVRMNEIVQNDRIHSHWNLLQQCALAMGNEQVRNRATIGGNICTASPAADSAPGLLVLEAKILIKGPAGNRCMDVKDFFINPKVNALKRGEIVAGVMIPQPPPESYWHYEKLSRRKAGDLAIVSVAVMATKDEPGLRWRLALGAVAPTPLRAYEAEKILNASHDAEAIDRAAASAYGCCCPISDIRSSMEYRQMMVVNITRKAIETVLTQIKEA